MSGPPAFDPRKTHLGFPANVIRIEAYPNRPTTVNRISGPVPERCATLLRMATSDQSDKGAAASGIAQQIEKLKAELQEVLDLRRRNEAAVEASRQKTNALLTEGSGIASREGDLRHQIAELETALKGLER